MVNYPTEISGVRRIDIIMQNPAEELTWERTPSHRLFRSVPD